MKVHIKSPRANKRKIVVPFAGEENFVVPKQGGYGQPDNEEWISIESNYANLTATPPSGPSPTDTTQIGEGLPTGTTTMENPNYNTSTGGIHGASTPSPTTTTSTQYPTGGSVDTTTITPELTNPVSTTTSGTSSGTTSNESTLPPLLDTGVVTPPRDTTTGTRTLGESTTTTSTTTSNTFQQTQIPTFPDFSTLDCSALASQIASIESQISQGNFTAEVGTAYNNALSTAKSLYTTKCNIASPAVIIAPVPSVPIGGGFGGSGGGFGEPPADETNISEEVTNVSSNKSWLIILAILGGLYFLTKRSNN
jgi:hypothetical protein